MPLAGGAATRLVDTTRHHAPVVIDAGSEELGGAAAAVADRAVIVTSQGVAPALARVATDCIARVGPPPVVVLNRAPHDQPGLFALRTHRSVPASRWADERHAASWAARSPSWPTCSRRSREAGPPGRRAVRRRSMTLAVIALVFAGALVLFAFGNALGAKGRYQRAADLAAISAAQVMRDLYPRLFEPPFLEPGVPNPRHLDEGDLPLRRVPPR